MVYVRIPHNTYYIGLALTSVSHYVCEETKQL